jgi:hypothetical protein
MVLGAAQLLRTLGGEEVGLGPGREEEELAGRHPARLLVRAGDGEEAALAFDHDADRFVDRRGDEGDADRAFAGAGPDPFGACAGLAEAAAGDDRPDAPRAVGLRLALVHLPPPFLVDGAQRQRWERAQRHAALLGGEGAEHLQDIEGAGAVDPAVGRDQGLVFDRPCIPAPREEGTVYIFPANAVVRLRVRVGKMYAVPV